ncbi:hypothetical protein J2X02_002704 [Pseudoxanthomonas japonensis]|uniref:hypothetical protein n=1 Tax=Pseudoxanthomonas TaxID=83618 RepID=UPI001E2B3E2C|nr:MULTISPECIES: hypothetical protein [Pseudoxanthomonas]MDR7069853.1 hypothetical protein [Pseudoxanthomonas japonensis]
MPRKLLLPMMLVGLLGALAWIPLRQAGQVSLMASPAVVADPQDASLVPLSSAPAVMRPMVARAVPALTSLRRGFEDSTDLFAYSRELMTLAAAGDADAMWLLSLVQDYCAGYSADPAGYAQDTRAITRLGLSNGNAMLSARQRVQQRCARFMPQDGFSLPTIVTQRQQAARAGSLAAEASLLAMERPLQDGDDYRRDLVQRVLDSGDPFAYLAIAPAMGTIGSGRRDTLGDVSGSELSEIAWRIASCQLGMDCSPNGSMMTNYCVNGGICSQDESQDFTTFARDAGVPRQGADNVDDMVGSLLARPGVDG